jgi:SAM-dependent methyltransferase
MNDPLDTNRRLWNEWTEIHVDSEFYDVEGFLAGGDNLDPLVLSAVGDVSGKSLLHLQCHFGVDTLALARRGATVTGADFSPKAIDAARDLANRAAIPATFVLSPIEDLPEHLDGEFDMVFTSCGVVPWLGDLSRWAAVIARFLAPDGRFVLVEGHPFMWIFDNERDDDRLVLDRRWNYFTKGPVPWPTEGTYADWNAEVVSDGHLEWMHSISSILTALIGAGLSIETFVEHPECGYQSFPFLVEGADGLWRVPDGYPSIPLSFTLTATR